MNTDMITYYKARANEYEKIYSKPERQEDLLTGTGILQDIFAGKEVCEIACGTGYWTERIAATAHSVSATDINESVIKVAKSKNILNVSFDVADLFNLDPSAKYECLFAGFIWSHIKLEELDHFIDTVNRLVETNGTIVFMDNNFVEGSSTAITETDDKGNTYQTRKLEDGTTHKVLKNFPEEKFFGELLKDKGFEITFINLKYYWILKCQGAITIHHY